MLDDHLHTTPSSQHPSPTTAFARKFIRATTGTPKHQLTEAASGAKMPTVLASTPAAAPNAKVAQVTGVRKNGKQWHDTKKPFRPNAGQTSYAKRAAKQAQEAEVKKLEKEMQAEREEERQRKIQAIKDKRAAKEEKERYELMAAKMHAKRVERLRRREKRNKLLKS